MQCTSSVHTYAHRRARARTDGRTERCSSWKVHLKYVFISFWNVDYVARQYFLNRFLQFGLVGILRRRNSWTLSIVDALRSASIYRRKKNSSENNILPLNRAESLSSSLEKPAWRKQNAVRGPE